MDYYENRHRRPSGSGRLSDHDDEAAHRRPASNAPSIPPTVAAYNKELRRQTYRQNTLAPFVPPSGGHRPGSHSPHRPSPHHTPHHSPSPNHTPNHTQRPPTPGRRPSNGGRPPALAAWELTRNPVPPTANTAPVPSILITTPTGLNNSNRSRTSLSAAGTPMQRRTNSFQVLVPGAEKDATPIPDIYIVMYCHKCYRLGCDRRQPGQTGDNTACPSCRHKPVEVPSTRSGLLACYSRAARQNKADPLFVGPVQFMMSLHYHTRARIVLFPSTTITSSDASAQSMRSGSRPFLDEQQTRQSVTYTFKMFEQGSQGAHASCTICKFPCGTGKNPVVKLEGCGHLFHAACVKSWVLEKNFTCPLCRTPMVERE